MNKLLESIYSSKATLVLLLIFATAIAIATFVEQTYDTETAKLLIYNSRWLELLYILLIINFIGNIKRYLLLKREKISGFIFHIAFIVMIIGAGISRYTGYEGMMHIREGSSSNLIYTNTPYLSINLKSGENIAEVPIFPGNNAYNSFKKKFKTRDNTIKIKYKDYKFSGNQMENDVPDTIELNIDVNGLSQIVKVSGGPNFNSYEEGLFDPA